MGHLPERPRGLCRDKGGAGVAQGVPEAAMTAFSLFNSLETTTRPKRLMVNFKWLDESPDLD
ncbi:hypothetical protein HS1genome_1607 [Sulfodiicoccus acidiphilus]|uniref:Uncharacterized protein n=1 Tax=Sulfodiicoccus acidiphilus TaxID=1670455 RepID=A0A348B4W6_9CREN|nr:hypothetical protein HS1genome_1607 [Sulfodiicoccus acidiphilus]GGU04848.1 hypothetical protein GCM10007116_21790 [Sulfodiicoccus acidiphilus]